MGSGFGTDSVFPPTSFFRRLTGALLLRTEVYEEIAVDGDAMRHAAAVVCLAALAQRSVLTRELGAWALPFLLAFGLLRWFLFGSLTYGMARLVTRQAVGYTRLLRCLGFAEGPGIVSIVTGALAFPADLCLRFLISFWLFAAVVVAVRAGLGVGAPRALFVASLSFFFYLAPGLAFGAPA